MCVCFFFEYIRALFNQFFLQILTFFDSLFVINNSIPFSLQFCFAQPRLRDK